MRKVLTLSLLAVALYACHKDAEHQDSDTQVAVDGSVELAVDATEVDAVDAADAVSPADVPSPVTP